MRLTIEWLKDHINTNKTEAQIIEKLNKIGIYSLEDLLFHLPIRYNDKTKLSKISDLEPGKKFLSLLEEMVKVQKFCLKNLKEPLKY